MTDTLSKKERSIRMGLIKSKNTGPELIVRKICRELGYTGYRLHRKDLIGKPDIAFIGRKIAIFVNGCFWHGHDCHGQVRIPKSNQDYWLSKIKRNKLRDTENLAELKELGWRVLVIWECETKDTKRLARKLAKFFAK